MDNRDWVTGRGQQGGGDRKGGNGEGETGRGTMGAVGKEVGMGR